MMPFRSLLLFVTILSVWSCNSEKIVVKIMNPTGLQRENEIIAIPASMLGSTIDLANPVHISTAASKRVLRYQKLDLDQDGSWEELLVEVSLDPQSDLKIIIEQAEQAAHQFIPSVYGRFVPERKDDFAWENDRVAFRMYGPALEATGEVSSGIDVWSKSVESLIIDKWYAADNYHKDHGEGADLYKVGPTLGCGGLGLLYDDSLYVSKNYTSYRVLAEGPLRFVFELDYAPWGIGDDLIQETKRITLDAGLHFNQIDSELSDIYSLPEGSRIVTGLSSHPKDSQNPVTINSSENYMLMYEAFKGDNGSIGTAIIADPSHTTLEIKKYGDQYLLPLQDPVGKRVSYHAGAAWSRSPWVKNEAEWEDLVMAYIQRLKHPLGIELITTSL